MNLATTQPAKPALAPPVHKMPAHWLLAQMGKRVLRPGGRELTRWMLANLAVGPEDCVVEFAPGLGETARTTIARHPASYTAIERDGDAMRAVDKLLTGPNQHCILGTAEATGLADKSATVVYGEAMLSMQPGPSRARIVGEAARLLKPGGRYAIHELCVAPDEIDGGIRDAIARELSDEIHAGVRPLTSKEWRELLSTAGFEVVAERSTPMRLLEPARLVKDEGLAQALRFAWNVARNAQARRRVVAMRHVFRKYKRQLMAISLVAIKPAEAK